MRPSRPPSLLGTLGLTALLLIVVGSVWPFVAPPYDRALVAALRPVTPAGIRLAAETPRLVFHHESGDRPSYRTSSPVLHFALIMCVAVVLGTPGMRWTVRLGSAAAIAAGIVISHLLVLIYVAHAVQAGSTGQLRAIYAVYWSMFPAVIAGMWCYLHWLPRWRSPRREGDGPS